MADFLDEVINDKNDELKLYYFKKFLPYVLIGSLVIIILMCFYNWKQKEKIEQNIRWSDTIIKIIDANTDNELKLKSIDSIISQSQGKSNIHDLAILEKVDLLLKAKDYNEAKKTLAQFIKDAKSPLFTQSYARILWLSLVIDQEKLDERDQNDFEDYLTHFKDESQPFYGSALIIKSLGNIKNNQPELAKDSLKRIISQGGSFPSTLKELASSLLVTLE